MIRDRLSRAGRMRPREIGWRLGAASRIARDRVRHGVRPPVWDRRQIAGILRQREAEALGDPIERADWLAAHRILARHIVDAPQRFVIGPQSKAATTERILRTFPGCAADARRRADAIVDGSYALLGYRDLRFGPTPADVDWHRDPVHARTAPRRFWADVPFLDPAVGDHKVIWELNRHQHWLALGRACWLTGDDRYRTLVIRQLEGWLRANPPLTGINWASMLELAFRSISWLWAIGFFAAADTDDESPWLVDLLLGMDRQLTHVEQNLSHYFSPNTHLLGEALALYVCGRSLPLLKRSGRRELLGRRILLDEIDRQIAPDGGHCERSTHYHRYALDFYLLALTIARLTRDPAAPVLADAAARLADAARLLADDSGILPHIGDDDGGLAMPMAGRPPDDIRDSLAAAALLLDRPDLAVGPAPEEAWWLVSHPDLLALEEQSVERGSGHSGRRTSNALPDTGYYISRGRQSHIVADAGPHGYLNGGHAHADALSLTLDVRGTPLLIDPGTASYTADLALRDRFRSSALHNTAIVDGRSQSTAAGPFKWGRTASARAIRWRTDPSFDYLEASHDGYAPAEHRRHLFALLDDLVIVADRVSGHGQAPVHVHWHLGADWRPRISGPRATFQAGADIVSLTVAGGRLALFSGRDAGNTSGLGWHAPIYGRVEPTSTVQIAQLDDACGWTVSVFCLNPANDVIAIEALPGERHGSWAPAISVRIARRVSNEFLVIDADAATSSNGVRRRWVSDGLESDAHLLFRGLRAGRSQIALVDGSFARHERDAAFDLRLPRLMPHLFMDLARSRPPQIAADDGRAPRGEIAHARAHA